MAWREEEDNGRAVKLFTNLNIARGPATLSTSRVEVEGGQPEADHASGATIEHQEEALEGSKLHKLNTVRRGNEMLIRSSDKP